MFLRRLKILKLRTSDTITNKLLKAKIALSCIKPLYVTHIKFNILKECIEFSFSHYCCLLLLIEYHVA